MDVPPETDTLRQIPSSLNQDTNYIGITIVDHDETVQESERIPLSYPSPPRPALSTTPVVATSPSSHGRQHVSSPLAPLPESSPADTSSSLPQWPSSRRSAARLSHNVNHDSFLKPSARYPKRNPLIMLTRELTRTYHACNNRFSYSANHNPRRVLTKPSEPKGNDGYDNEESDYVLYVNDVLGTSEGHKYLVLDILGSGTFGQVAKCRNLKTNEIDAVKVVKNKLAYFKQSTMEIAILEQLNQRHDPHDKHHILRLKDTFVHQKHLCLVFELMSVNLYELIKQNQFRGLSTNLIRVFVGQILDALTVLNEARIIHCDLKPENILLKSLESPTIKVIDFGSACYELQTVYTYIQSRFYRSPEVLLGLPYTSAIDMWSLGCIATELFLGLPLFPGSSEYNQISRIVDMLGTPPTYMLEMGKNAGRYFERTVNEMGEKNWNMIPLERYARELGRKEEPSKQFFTAKTLPDLITSYPIMRKSSMSAKEIEREQQNRLAFIDFLQGLLNLNHLERWSPQQAKQHPFITGEAFLGPFQPPYIPRQQAQPMKIPRSMPSLSVAEAPTLGFTPGYLSPSQAHPAISSAFGQPNAASLPSYLSNKGADATKREPLASHENSTRHAAPTVQIPYMYTYSSDPSLASHPMYSLPIASGRPRANTISTVHSRRSYGFPSAHLSVEKIDENQVESFSKPTDESDFSHPQHFPGPSEVYIPYESVSTSLLRSSSRRIPSETTISGSDDGSSSGGWEKQARLADLERGGDWKETRRHRRSNSAANAYYTDVAVPSNGSTRLSMVSNVASLHRRVRGQVAPFHRQDLEWDGVHCILPPPAPTVDRPAYDTLPPSDPGACLSSVHALDHRASWRSDRGSRLIHPWSDA